MIYLYILNLTLSSIPGIRRFARYQKAVYSYRMHLIAGLGNPGIKYDDTRHNAGFMALERFADKHDLPQFAYESKHSSFMVETVFNDEKVILAEPDTFMNRSGEAVSSIVRFYKIPTQNIIVLHDDIDIEIGKVKVSRARGPAGHRGVTSIMQHLGTKEITRIRIGILPLTGKPDDPRSFVLKKFSQEESGLLDSSIEQACLEIERFIS